MERLPLSIYIYINVTEKGELSCMMMYCRRSSSYTRSELEMHCEAAVTFFSLVFSSSSLPSILSFSLVLFTVLIYFSFSLRLYSRLTQLIVEVQALYFSTGSFVRSSLLLLTVCVKRKNSCLTCSMIGYNLTASSSKKKKTPKKNLFFFLCV